MWRSTRRYSGLLWSTKKKRVVATGWPLRNAAPLRSFLLRIVSPGCKITIVQRTFATSLPDAKEEEEEKPPTRKLSSVDKPSYPFSSPQAHKDWFWQHMLERFKAYQAKHGHGNVPMDYNDPQDSRLYNGANKKMFHLATWVSRQRGLYKQNKMPEERKKILNDLGFCWKKDPSAPPDLQEKKWNVMMKRFQTFFQKHGHPRVPLYYFDGQWPLLGQWLSNQRGLYNKGKLSDERAQQLLELGFEEKSNLSQEKFEARWKKMYQLLVAYHKENGNCLVPVRFKGGLGDWTNRQRQLYNKNELATDRRQLLEALDFERHARDSKRDSLLERLQAFYKQHGHCRVPTTYQEDKPLADWVHRQRRLYTVGRLDDNEKQELESIGFTFHVMEEKWNAVYNRLVVFYEEHGHTKVPESWKKKDTIRPHLGGWVSRQRKLYRQNKLSEERVRKLESIGFQWNVQSSEKTS